MNIKKKKTFFFFFYQLKSTYHKNVKHLFFEVGKLTKSSGDQIIIFLSVYYICKYS